MINIDFLTLNAFFNENIDFFIGARLQKIQQPTRRDLIFSLRNNSISKKLYINIHPQMYHICFMSKENEYKRNIIIPQKPPMFCMLLRKYLEGAKITDACVIKNERILELHFETYDELSQTHTLCLAIELMGKHSNVILYDKNDCIIIGCAHNVGAEKSRYRELQGGLKYIYPPVNSNQKLSNELQKQFTGLKTTEIENYLNTDIYTPSIKDGRYTLFKELLPNSNPQKSVSDMLDNYYADIQEQVNLKAEKLKLQEIAISKLKKIKNAISKISALLEKRDNTEKYKLYGELLSANLYKTNNYTKNIEVWDYINNKNIIIELDETKTLNENAQRYYRLYKKSKTTKEKSEELLSNLHMEQSCIENILYSINSAKTIKDLDDIKTELGITDKKTEKPVKPKIEKIKFQGFDIYIGKNNKQNDYIISKLMKDNDIWFHTRLCAGSHVLLKTEGKVPDEVVIYECCKIARENSSASMPSKVGVIYTNGKYLRKPPAAPLGYVTYKNEKEILI